MNSVQFPNLFLKNFVKGESWSDPLLSLSNENGVRRNKLKVRMALLLVQVPI